MRTKKLLLTILFVLGILNSCNEDDSSTKQDIAAEKIQLVSFNMSNDVLSKGPEFSTSGTMLSFDSFADYEQTIAFLEQQMENYDDTFLKSNSNLTEQQLDDLEDNIGYNPQQPLIEFENSLGFTNSLRKKYNLLVEEWLDNVELNPATDPDNSILFDEIEQTLWNEHQEIMIGGKVFVLGKSFNAYQINADYAPNLELINLGEDVSDNPNIIITDKASSCTNWKSRNDSDEYDNKKIKRVITIRSVNWFCMTSARIVSYKKKGNKWKIKRTQIGVSLQTYLKDKSCSNTIRQGFKFKSIKNRRERTVRMFDWGEPQAYRAVNGNSLFGIYYRGNSSSSKVLTW